MKKIVLIFIGLISISVSCMAQTAKGKILLGGYAYFNSLKVEGRPGTGTGFGINPVSGVFIADNLVIGTGVGYIHSSYPQANVSETEVSYTQRKAHAISVNPFGRYYVGITPQIKFFGQLEASANWQTIKGSDAKGSMDNKDAKSNFYSASLSPGFAIFPSKKIGVELSFNGLEFSKQRWKSEGITTSDSKTISIGSNFFNPRLGIQFYL